MKACLDEIRLACPQMLIQTSADVLRHYSSDESTSTNGYVHAVFFPTNTQEVSVVLKHAEKHRIPVIPRGAGSGLSGACVPIQSSFILSLEKMNRILEIDEQNHTALVEPGAITKDLRDAAEAKNLYYPPIPSSLDFCTLGGNVATNAGGLCAVKYGVTRKYILGLEVVVPGGEIINTGGKFVKHTTGYDLSQLIAGSEGTLAVITQILFSLLPLPSERATLLVPFDSVQIAAKCVQAFLSQGLVPPTLELMPKEAIDCVLKINKDMTFPFKNEAATLLIELDAFSKEALLSDTEKLYEILKAYCLAEPLLASSSMQREDFWSVRKSIREAIKRADIFVEADAVVPRHALPKLIEAAQVTATKFGVNVISYGHAGDGNLHTYFQKGTLSDAKWKAIIGTCGTFSTSKASGISASVIAGDHSSIKNKLTKDHLLSHFFQQVIDLGGTISGEHGIGFLKRDYLPLAISEKQLEIMRQIKKAFDPRGILNPGKVLADFSSI